MRYGVVVLMFILVSSVCSAAGKTIYRCKDANGRMVFQHEVCADNQITGNAPEHVLWRDMRRKVVQGKSILNKLSGDIQSIRACKSSMIGFRSELEALKPRLAKLPPEHKLLVKSYGYLYECGVCRTSAASSCDLANDYLDKAMFKLTEH